MEIGLQEEIANYLLNNCFIIGNVDSMREKYYYVLDHEEPFRKIFQPLGYTIVIHRNLRVIQLINSHGRGRIPLKKYESIVLLIFRLIYIQKRESLTTDENMVYATVEEIKNEYEKLNLPRKFDKKFLQDSIINIKKYNLVNLVDKLTDLEARIQIYPSIMLAMPDSLISNVYEETRKFLYQYKNMTEEDDEE